MSQHNQEHLDTLQEIRSMMERSSRFISLSGLSGIVAGLSALAGAALVYLYLDTVPFKRLPGYYIINSAYTNWGIGYRTFFVLVASMVLLLALAAGIYFTTRAARNRQQKIWDALTKRLLINLMIPLAAGGIFCLGLLYHNLAGLVAPATLLFYGLALINASKYTLNDIRYLGISQIVLGLFGVFFVGYGLDLWAIGFGVLHIIYGTSMYYKYESN
jgi:hypothetical protein